MKIALVHAEYTYMPKVLEEINPKSDTHTKNTVRSIREVLEKAGHDVILVPANVHMLKTIVDVGPVDLIYCYYTPLENLHLQGNVFAALELLGIPMVGPGMFTQTIGLSKETTKIILRSLGVPTPASQVFMSPDDPLHPSLLDSFPLFVKPESEGASVGVHVDSYVEDEEALRQSLRRIFKQVNPPIIVETFLPGREFTVGVLQKNPLIALPVVELKFTEDSVVPFRSIETKVADTMYAHVPAEIDDNLAQEMQELAKIAFKALRCEVYARVDMRLDAEGNPQVIEVNTMPGLEKGHSLFETSAKAMGMEYDELILTMVDIALKPKKQSKYLGVGKF